MPLFEGKTGYGRAIGLKIWRISTPFAQIRISSGNGISIGGKSSLRHEPNRGHEALARWDALAADFQLVTQNVDGLHRAAGSRRVLELHGNIRINRCLVCGVESTMDEITYSGSVPYCACGGMLRPGVVWFGEALPESILTEAVAAAQQCDLFLLVGTSAVVHPAALLPEYARAHGAVVIEINTEDTAFTPLATYHLRGPAGTVLPELLQAYETAHMPTISTTQAP